MKPILEIKNISKKFIIHHEKKQYLSLRDSISATFKITRNNHKEIFWALKDISFNVYPGESIGIIGRNGAGKSTLLKILSKITPPSLGRIISRGRIASLLEVGTGFHPELTGKENIFLNGSILGMKRKEIQNKFDEIVDFSGVEKFLDTPLKHYSSGMQLRLAFAVSAFLEPEILVIDEVLAVGDSAFQQRCINKMMEVVNTGRTILFVSHNFSAVKALCKKVIMLNNGEKIFEGGIDEGMQIYNSQNVLSDSIIDLGSIKRTWLAREIIFNTLMFKKYPFHYGEPIEFTILLKSNTTSKNKTFQDLDIGISIVDLYRNTIIHISNKFINLIMDHTDDNTQYSIKIENILKPGTYYINFFLRTKDIVQDWITELIQFRIEGGNPYNYFDTAAIQGMIFPDYEFKFFPLK